MTHAVSVIRSGALGTATWACLAGGLAASLIGGLAGCGGAGAQPGDPGAAAQSDDPPAALPTAAFFIPGEVMTFEVTFRGVTGGSAVLAVGEPGTLERHPAIIVRSHLESAGLARLFKEVRDDVTSSIDLTSGMPLTHHTDLIFGDRRTVVQARFSGHRVAVDYRRQHLDRPGTQRPHRRNLAVPRGEAAHDAHSALGAMRAWNPAPGGKIYFYTVSVRRVWLSTVAFAGRETVRTALGRFSTLRLDGVTARLDRKLQLDKRKKPRTFTMWLSDDESRLPLRIVAHTEHGDVMVEMTAYQRPDRPVASR